MIVDSRGVRDLTVVCLRQGHAGGMSVRRVFRWAAVVAAFVAVVAGPLAAPAWAREDPPEVTGLPVADATAKLAAWNKAVFFQYEPAPDIDLGVDPSDVLVARTEWPQGSPAVASVRPVARLILGRRVPDLAGLTEQRAREEATLFAFRVLASPAGVGPDWIVGTQTPAAGTIVEFVNGPRVIDVVLTAPVTPTPTIAVVTDPNTPPEPELSTVEVVLLAGGAGLTAGLLLILGILALRRALRRGSPDPELAERIEVRPHAGETTGPVLIGAEADR